MDETIASSKDGGTTWETKHHNPDGEILFAIAFVDDKVAYAAGTGGLLLSTNDGGQTWKAHVAPGVVRAFSFANATDGIAVISQGSSNHRAPWSDHAVPIDGVVKLTHNGGESWEDVAAMDTDEFQPFVQTLSVAALDKAHFLMLRRQPEVEDIFGVTEDGGKSWKVVRPRNDATNRALPRMVFVHAAEYWAFGYELIHREKGGGYGVPLALHSKNGVTWTYGIAGPKEFASCTAQGCYMWDGVIEVLYDEHEQFWALPQDGSLGEKWAITENTGCTINNGSLKCARASTTEKPLDRPEPPDGIYRVSNRPNFVEGCVECQVDGIVPDHAGPPSAQRIHASIKVRRNGTVASASVDHLPSKRMSEEISTQLSKWLLEPRHKGSNTVETTRDISLILMCAGFPDRPETNRCTIHNADEFSGLR